MPDPKIFLHADDEKLERCTDTSGSRKNRNGAGGEGVCGPKKLVSRTAGKFKIVL